MNERIEQLTLLPTSSAGSLPKPSWLATPEKLWSPWLVDDEQLPSAKQDALILSLHDQVQVYDIVSDGEQTVSILSPRSLST